MTNDPHNTDAVAFLVDTPAVAPWSVRVNVMLLGDVPRTINKVSGNRSRFLADAALEKLGPPETVCIRR